MDVKEGFLCPICMADLGDVIQLQVHFDEDHSKEDPAVVKNIKDFFLFQNQTSNDSSQHISINQFHGIS